VSLYAGQGREQLRAAWRGAWRKWRQRLPLEPLEAQLADIIGAHPEYHRLLEADLAHQPEFGPEPGRDNPFLHLGLHLALREQIGTDRPAGIARIHQRLAARAPSPHEAEHRMMEVLASMLSDAQRSGLPPLEPLYLERLQRL